VPDSVSGVSSTYGFYFAMWQYIRYSNYYSVLNATTGSFLAAIRDGTNPAISVKHILPRINIPAYKSGRLAIPATPASYSTMELIGICKRYAIPTPISPAVNPIKSASALNTLDISFFLAPTERKIPISFVRSITDT